MKKSKAIHDGPKILTLDLETAPLQSYHWGLFDQNISINQIQVEWSILSYSAKWLHEKKVMYKDTSGRGVAKVRDDSELLKDLWKLLDEADIVVTQNGISFDIKKINSRMLMAKMKPYSPIKQIDTKVEAKRHFNHTSNRLEWMSKHLTNTKKDTHKEFPGFELWTECLKDNPKAWREMRKYNIKDTVATEELYLAMRPWIAGHHNVAVYSSMDKEQCPKCGSTHIQLRGAVMTQTGKYRRIQCQDCGGWSRTRKLENSKQKRASLLTN